MNLGASITSHRTPTELIHSIQRTETPEKVCLLILDLAASAHRVQADSIEDRDPFTHNDATVFERANADEALYNPENAASSVLPLTLLARL